MIHSLYTTGETVTWGLQISVDIPYVCTQVRMDVCAGGRCVGVHLCPDYAGIIVGRW